MDIWQDVRVRKQVRELLIAMQRSLEAGKQPTLPNLPEGKGIRLPVEPPLFSRSPGIGDIVEKAVQEFKDKYGLP